MRRSLPVFIAAAVLLFPFIFRNIVLAPLALGTAERALSRSVERPVTLDAGEFSGSWFWDISIEDVEFYYGEGPFVIRSASVGRIVLNYDPFENLDGDAVSALSSVEIQSAELQLNRRAAVREIEEEIEDEPDLTARQIRSFLRRTLPTPRLALQVAAVLPETQGGTRFSLTASGRLETGLALRLSDGEDSFAFAVDKNSEGIVLETNSHPTTVAASLRGEVRAPDDKDRGIEGSLRFDSDPLVFQIETRKRDLSFAVDIREGLAEEIARWSRRLSQDLIVLPAELGVGTAQIAGSLALLEEGPDNYLTLLLSSSSPAVEVLSGEVTVLGANWSYRGSPQLDIDASAVWRPSSGRIAVDELVVDAAALGSVEATELLVDPARRVPITEIGSVRIQARDIFAALDAAGLEGLRAEVPEELGAAVEGGLRADILASSSEVRVTVAGVENQTSIVVRAQGSSLFEGRVETGSFELRLPMPTAEDQDGLATASGGFAGAFLDGEGNFQIDGSAELEGLSIPDVVGSSAESRLESVTFEAALSGPLEAPHFDVTFEAAGLRVNQRRFAVAGRIVQDDRSVLVRRLDAERPSGLSLHAEGRLPLLVGASGFAVQNLRRSSLTFDARVPSLHPLVPENIRSVVPGGETVVEGRLVEDTGDLSFRMTIAGGREEEATEAASSLSYSDATAQFRIVEDTEDRLRTEAILTLDGTEVLRQQGLLTVPGLSSASPSTNASDITISSTLSLELPLAVLPSLIPQLIYAEGQVRGDIRTEGDLGSAASEGTLEFVNGGARFPGPLPALTALNGTVRLSNDGLDTERLRGEFGRAPFTASASYGRSDRSLDLELQGDNVLMVSQPGIRIRSDVDLRANGSLDGLSIAGNLSITEAQYTQNVPLLQFDSPPTVDEDAIQLFSVPGDFAAATTLDVQATAENTILVSNNVYRGRLSVDARLSGNLRVPVVIGRVFADSGTVRLPVTDLRLTNLTFEFPQESPFSPELQARGETRLRNYDVYVQAYGTVPTIEVQVSSNPPLPQEEAILLLTTGYTDIEALGEGNRGVVTAGRFVGRRLASLLFGPEEAADATAFDRLDIAVGRRLSTGGNEVIEVDFRLGSGDNWYLEFERDEFDRYNLALAWRFAFR